MNSKLDIPSSNIKDANDGMHYISVVNELIPQCFLEFQYWQQRMKAKWVKFGDLSSPMLYNKVKQKMRRKEVLMLLNEEGEWVNSHEEISKTILTSILSVYLPTIRDDQGEKNDLLLRELDLPKISQA